MRHRTLIFLVALVLPLAAHARRPRDTDGESGAGAFLCGQIAMAESRFDVAALKLRIAFNAEPANPEIGRQALAANLLAGQPFTPTIARALARVQPGNPVAQLVLAGIEVLRANWASAARHDASMQPEGVFALMQQPLLAWEQFGAGRKDAMRAVLGPGHETGTVGGTYLVQEGLMADLADRPQLAEHLYRAAQGDLGAEDFGLARALASLLARQGRAGEAEKTLAAADIPGLHLSLSGARLRQDMARRPVADAGDAIAALYVDFSRLARQHAAPLLADMLLRLALDLRPEFSVARLLAAQALAADGHDAAALAMLAPVDTTDPLAPSADFLRATALAATGNGDQALKILAELQAEVPEHSEPWALQGDVLSGMQRDAGAASAYARALALMAPADPGRPRCLYRRGLAEERAGQWPAAEADFLAALSLSPDDPVVLNHLGLAWVERGVSLDRARQMIGQAARLRPQDASIADSLGEVELRQGDVAAAVHTLEHAVELMPDSAAGNRHLGDAYAAAGRTLEARFQWDRAQALSRPLEKNGPF